MTASNFDRALELTLRYEGGYSDHPADPGGVTNLGVTRAVLSEWRGTGVTRDEVRSLSFKEAAAIYRRRYWDAVGSDELPSGLDAAVFDYAVNSGPDRASRALQRAIGVPEDGIVGMETVATARLFDQRKAILRLCSTRRGFLAKLKIFPIFGRGWLRRVDAVETFALSLQAQSVKSQTMFPIVKETTPMNFTKSILESRTVWANVIGLVALGATTFGFDAGALDQGATVDAILKTVSSASFIASTLFRVKATKRIG